MIENYEMTMEMEELMDFWKEEFEFCDKDCEF